MLFKIYRAAEKNPQIERDQADHFTSPLESSSCKKSLRAIASD